MEALRVACVEDDEKLGRLTARYLESHGVEVTVYQDPEEGIAGVLRTRPDGTGLGVGLARRVAHAHGGELSQASDVGVGTCASVRLPLRGSGPLPLCPECRV